MMLNPQVTDTLILGAGIQQPHRGTPERSDVTGRFWPRAARQLTLTSDGNPTHCGHRGLNGRSTACTCRPVAPSGHRHPAHPRHRLPLKSSPQSGRSCLYRGSPPIAQHQYAHTGRRLRRMALPETVRCHKIGSRARKRLAVGPSGRRTAPRSTTSVPTRADHALPRLRIARHEQRDG